LPLQNAVLNEPVEAVGEHITSQSDPALEVLESPGPVERLPQGSPTPSVPPRWPLNGRPRSSHQADPHASRLRG
jgi:hypothetical protein